MKTAVSIPDEVFDVADALTKRLGISRSRLYSKAITQFVKKYRTRDITERLNQVYSGQDSRIDPVLLKGQLASLIKERW